MKDYAILCKTILNMSSQTSILAIWVFELKPSFRLHNYFFKNWHFPFFLNMYDSDLGIVNQIGKLCSIHNDVPEWKNNMLIFLQNLSPP